MNFEDFRREEFPENNFKKIFDGIVICINILKQLWQVYGINNWARIDNPKRVLICFIVGSIILNCIIDLLNLFVSMIFKK